LAQRLAASLELLQAAHRTSDRGADPVGLQLELESGVRPGLPRGRDRQLREAAHSPRLPVADPAARVEASRLASEPDREPTRIERRDRASGGATADQPFPARLNVAPERRHRPEPGDHDSPVCVGAQGPRTTVTISPTGHSLTKSSRPFTRSVARTAVSVRSISRTTVASTSLS